MPSHGAGPGPPVSCDEEDGGDSGDSLKRRDLGKEQREKASVTPELETIFPHRAPLQTRCCGEGVDRTRGAWRVRPVTGSQRRSPTHPATRTQSSSEQKRAPREAARVPGRPACQAVGVTPRSAPGGPAAASSAHASAPGGEGAPRTRTQPTAPPRLALAASDRQRPGRRAICVPRHPRGGQARAPPARPSLPQAPFALFASRGSCTASPSPSPRLPEELIVFRVEHPALSTDPQSRARCTLVNGAVNIVNI